jgi:hypothetical protein
MRWSNILKNNSKINPINKKLTITFAYKMYCTQEKVGKKIKKLKS